MCKRGYTTSNIIKTLRKGIRTFEVSLVKGFLKDEGYYCGEVNNDFEDALDNSVKIYQRDKNLVADGVIGANTYKAFRKDGFLIEGNEPELFGTTEEKIRDVVRRHSGKLIADKNKTNPEPTTFDPDKDLIVVAIRGFNLNMGEDQVNDRSIYDDAHFVITPEKVIGFEANTDPNGYRKGRGTGREKGMAMLKTGVWFFGKGRHKGTPAFRQVAPFTVIRDGNPDYEDTGYFAINWHHGGNHSTSSLGCQTNRPNDFNRLRDYIYKYGQENPKMKNDWGEIVAAIPYILINKEDF